MLLIVSLVRMKCGSEAFTLLMMLQSNCLMLVYCVVPTFCFYFEANCCSFLVIIYSNCTNLDAAGNKNHCEVLVAGLM